MFVIFLEDFYNVRVGVEIVINFVKEMDFQNKYEFCLQVFSKVKI